MCLSERFIVYVYLAGILIQNNIVFAQSSGDPCIFHDVMDSVDIVRYANSVSGSTCPVKTVSGGWDRFGTTGTGEIITSCPTGNQCGGGNRIWINGSTPGHTDGIFSACLKVGSSCCVRTQNVSMKSCGSYFIYNIGHFIPCSTICLVQTTTKLISNPTSAATPITQNTVTTSSMTMTNRHPSAATEKDTSNQTPIIVGSTVGGVVIVLALSVVFVILILRRRGQQTATNQPSPGLPSLNANDDTATSDDFISMVAVGTRGAIATSHDDQSHYKSLPMRPPCPTLLTFSNAGYSKDNGSDSNTQGQEAYDSVGI